MVYYFVSRLFLLFFSGVPAVFPLDWGMLRRSS